MLQIAVFGRTPLLNLKNLSGYRSIFGEAYAPMNSEEDKIINNEAAGRFDLEIEGQRASIYYERHPDNITFLRTYVHPELSGKGVGSRLAKAALDYAREEGLGVVPYCRFVSAYIRRHPEYQELVVQGEY
jgi:predicted GNAT family acetyltransferase